MNGKRMIGALSGAVLAASLGLLAACGDAEEKKEVPTAEAVSAASVSIELYDASGARVGEGTGTLIAPRLVLTAGHNISGHGKWVVKSGKGQKVTGSRGLTYDWGRYDSELAHPRRNDVGVIQLDEPIQLAAYPKIAAAPLADGAHAMRVRGNGASFSAVDADLARLKTAPNSYLTDFGAAETLDTGGAVYDQRGIVGVVSGVGNQTGRLYIARTDRLAAWLSPKVACSGAISAKAFADNAPKVEECDDAGNPLPTSGENPPGAGPNAPGANPPGAPVCPPTDNDGICSGDCGPAAPPVGGPSSPQNPASGNPPGSSPPGSNPPGSNPPGSNPPGADPANPKGGPSSTTDTSTDSPESPNASSPSTGGVTSYEKAPNGVPLSPSEGDLCQGPSDNPELCPPEPDGCQGPSCGGGEPDRTIRYGSCGCTGTATQPTLYLR